MFAEDLITDVILEGHKRGIGAFPVVDKGHLVGIVTEGEIFRAIIQIFGTRTESEILSLENGGPEESIGVFRRIAEIAENMKIPILAIFALPHRRREGSRVYVRIRTKNTRPFQEALVEAGFQLGE